TVELVTLDGLIAQFGVPDFIKIDVEGFELEVLSGLSRSVPLISLEWTPELTDNLLQCIDLLAGLGPISCNLSWTESMRLARREWITRGALAGILEHFREETYLFGDVYVRAGAAG
ncbi:MAG TPA: FkbM family methyltransferase, partial [Chthoniobacteraceae bacterium]